MSTTEPSAPYHELKDAPPTGFATAASAAMHGRKGTTAVVSEAFDEPVNNLPFRQPNAEREEELALMINGVEPAATPFADCCHSLASGLCCLTGLGCCYLWAKNILVKDGEYGFAMDNGTPRLLLPGRHILLSPLNRFVQKHDAGSQLIKVGPITIVRVPRGRLGFAMNGSEPEILLPGRHCRTTASFSFSSLKDINDELIEFGPIKILTVKSGGVRVCYANGRVQIYSQGRYGINSGTFSVGANINTQQQNMRFEKHPVLLDGGISMLVEGLLTYQVTNVETLIHQLGERDLRHSLQDVTKAELARVFASLHLEQISQASSATKGKGKQPGNPLFDEVKINDDDEDEDKPEEVSFLGKTKDSPVSSEGQTRMWICAQVIKSVQPIAQSWGVNIINFQLESTKIADAKYAKEYEAASLAMAKAKANLRAVTAQNKIQIQTARANAAALKIEMTGKKEAVIIEASGKAEARKIEAASRNEAALAMKDDFAKEFAMAQTQVDAVRALRANHLTVIPESAAGGIIARQPLFAAQKR